MSVLTLESPKPVDDPSAHFETPQVVGPELRGLPPSERARWSAIVAEATDQSGVALVSPATTCPSVKSTNP